MTTQPQTQPQPQPQPRSQPPGLPRTRVGGTWTAVAAFAVVLLLLLIFILQNGRGVEVSYLGAHGHLPLGVALLLAAVCGALLVTLAGGARILQLRAHARRGISRPARPAPPSAPPAQPPVVHDPPPGASDETPAP
jgi:uncharacterized integral membrane protein